MCEDPFVLLDPWLEDCCEQKNFCLGLGGLYLKKLLECIFVLWWISMNFGFFVQLQKDVFRASGFRVVENRCFGLLAHPTPAGRIRPKQKTSHG